MTRHATRIVRLLPTLAVLVTASVGVGQTIPRTRDFGARLPSLPTPSALGAGEMALRSLPGGKGGIQIAPGVMVDRLNGPRCIFVGNMSSAGGTVQRTDVGRLEMYCP